MKKNFILTLAVMGAFTLSACESLNQNGQKETLGAGVGAIVGGVLASNVGGGKGQLVAVGVGTLLGALVGSEIGRSLDKADMLYAQRANQQAHSAPLGETISWNNPESGNSGSVTPRRDGRSDGGEYCREYEQVIYVDGQQETAVGIACQSGDGKWKIAG